MIRAKKSVEGLKPYQSPKIIRAETKLNQNESPYNLPPAIVGKIKKRIGEIGFNRYNEGSSKELRELIAKKFAVLPEQIIVGAGIDEILYYLMLAFLDKGDKVVRPIPSFAMYEICSRISGAVDIPVKLTKNFELGEEFVRQAKTARMVFICRPNNPTSNSFDKETIEKIIRNTRGLVCIDEAYAEFAKDNCLEFLRYENVVIMRTFSKAYSCAGVRLGYAISSPQVIERLDRVRLPWNVSVLSQIVGETVLGEEGFFGANIEEIKSNRDLLAGEMKKFTPVLPSDCNFITFRVENPDYVFEELVKRNVLVRNVSGYPMLKNFLRVSVGTGEENARFLSALKKCICTKGIIFDIDGVLVDVSKSYRKAIIETVKTITGRDLNDKDIRAIKELPNSNNDWDVAYALITGTRGLKSIDRGNELYLKTKEIFQQLYLGGLRDYETPIAKLSTLKSLQKQGYLLGIVTSRPRAEALYILDKLMPGIFNPEYIIAQEDCRVEKPDPEPILLAKKAMGCASVAYVGDTINDALSARAAGIKFISVTKGLDSDIFIDNVNKIKVIL